MNVPFSNAAWSQPRNSLILELPVQSRQLLNENLHTRQLPIGTLCFSSGASVKDVYFPLTGTICLTSTTRGGDTLRTAMIGREGAAGLQGAISNRDSLTNAFVQTAGSFHTISAHRLRALACRDAEIKEWVFAYTERTWQEALQMTLCNAAHDASSRLCRCLLQGADRLGSDQLPFTQEMLSEMLGVRRTTVTEQAQVLQKLNLISYSRGKIVLLNRTELEKHACECYDILKSEHAASDQVQPAMASAGQRIAAMELPA